MSVERRGVQAPRVGSRAGHVRQAPRDGAVLPRALGELRLVQRPDGAAVAVRRTGNPRGPRLLLGHGNGFAVGAFAPLARLLDASHEVFRLDLRNHGASPLHRLEGHVPEAHVGDVGAVVEALRLQDPARPLHGVFHSISGVFALEFAVRRPGAFDSLTLMEPPLALSAGEAHAKAQAKVQQDLAHMTRRRRSRFPDPGSFADRLRGRPPFEGLTDPALAIYARAVLRRSGADGFELACPPAFESALYASNTDRGVFDRLPGLGIRGTVVASDRGDLRGEIAGIIARRAGFDLVRLSGVSHLMPMEDPDAIARIAARRIREHDAVKAI